LSSALTNPVALCYFPGEGLWNARSLGLEDTDA